MMRASYVVSLFFMSGLLAGCGLGEAKDGSPAAVEAEALPDDVRDLVPEAPLSEGNPALPAGGDTPELLTITGEFRANVTSALGTRIKGRVGAVHVDEGDLVTRGQLLLELETEYLHLERRRAEAELDGARAALGEAERDLERKKELLGRESVPQALYDRTQAALEQARAAEAIAETELALAEQRLEDARLVSPIDGVVQQRHVGVGEKIGESTVTFVLVQTAPLQLRFRVPERYIGKLKKGQSVHAVVDPYPGETFEGNVRVIGLVVDSESRTVFVEAEFANEDGRLRPGLFARVDVNLARGTHAEAS